MSVALPPEAAEVARAAVLDAVLVCREAARRLAEVGRIAKPDESPVTVADFAAQAVIVRRLRALGRPIVGEEQAAVLREPANAALRDAVVAAVRPVWPDAEADAVLEAIDGAGGVAEPHGGYFTVDPIDGTRGFVRGGQYAVCLAWIADGSPQLGLMGCPNLPRELDASMSVIDPEGTLFVAEAGAPLRWGTAVPGAELHAVDRSPRRDTPSPLVVTRSLEGTYSRVGDVARVLARLGVPIELRLADSQAKYGMVARGQAHAYLRIPLHRSRAEQVWDHAPGWMVATAAGMRVTDLAGAPFDFTCGERLERSYGVVCAPPPVHEALIDAIAALGLQHRDG